MYTLFPVPRNASSLGVSFTAPVTAPPTLSSTPLATTLATAIPTLISTPYATTMATALPILSSAPFNTTVFTVESTSPSLTPVMSSSVAPPVILPPAVQRWVEISLVCHDVCKLGPRSRFQTWDHRSRGIQCLYRELEQKKLTTIFTLVVTND